MKRRSKSVFVLLTIVFCMALLVGFSAVASGADNGAATTGVSVNTGSVLYGKTALFCGDSICAGMPKAPEAKRGWAGRIGLLYGMKVTNNGRAAATVAIATDRKRGRSLDNRIVTQIEAVKDNTYDYVILHGGINDGMDSIAVGTMTDSHEVADFDTSTFAGALEELFYRANEHFGDKAQVGYIVNYQTPMSNWGGATRDMSAYVKVALQICDKWKVSYLDLYDDEVFNQDVMKVSTKENLVDYLHPNDGGYDLLSAKIGPWMETLEQPESPVPWIIGGAVLVIVAGGATTALILVRRKRKSAQTVQ